MEPESSPQRVTPEQYPVPLPTEGPENRVAMDQDLVERFMSQVTENALGVLDFSRQWTEYEAKMELMEESIKEKSNELEKKEEKFRLKQDAEARDIEVKSKSLELNEKKLEELMRELEVRKQDLEARQKDLSLLDETIQEISTELEKREEQFQLKQDAESRELEVKRKSLELKEKKLEDLMRELEVRKQELETRQKDLNLLDEFIQEKYTEMEKREEQFQLKQDAKFREIEVKSKSLEFKEKKLEDLMRELEARQKELSLLDEIIKEKSTELEKKEDHQVRKEKELDERSKEAENSKRSRDEYEPSSLVEKNRDDDSLIHPGKKHQPIREQNHDEKEKETDVDCVLYGKTSSDPASATATANQAKGREVCEVACIDDGAYEDPERYSFPDPDFNNFKHTMSSFAVGQVWALYDPLDHMPRYYAQIRRILKPQLSVEVKWLESVQNTEDKELIPIACGEFKYGDSKIQSHLTLSHEMHHMIHIKNGKNVTVIYPRKGETWALFRDWTKTWISHREQYEPPYRYDFVEVELESDQGIGVAYLGRVEGFTSVYKPAEQHGIIKMMIPSDEMLRFSHRVPSFVLTGDEKEGVPAGSFELDPATIPRDCLEATCSK